DNAHGVEAVVRVYVHVAIDSHTAAAFSAAADEDGVRAVAGRDVEVAVDRAIAHGDLVAVEGIADVQVHAAAELKAAEVDDQGRGRADAVAQRDLQVADDAVGPQVGRIFHDVKLIIPGLGQGDRAVGCAKNGSEIAAGIELQ